MAQKNGHHAVHHQNHHLHAHIGKTTTRPKSYGLAGDSAKIIKHHVPPRVPDQVPRTIRVDEQSEMAYHHLFGNAKSYKDACEILKRDWWPYEQEPPKL